MSRTYKNKPYNKFGLRKPQTFNQLSALSWLKYDPDLKEIGYVLSGRDRRHIPTSWDDLFVSHK